MDRRQFFSSTGSVAATAAAGVMAPATVLAQSNSGVKLAGAKRSLMKLGADIEKVNDATMKAMARWGIKNCYARATIADKDRLYPTVDELHQMRDIAERNGLTIDILRPPNLTMSNVDDEKHPAIMLGESPQRDRDIDAFQTMIKNCAEAGIPGIRYTLSIVGNTRSGTVPGRGDSTYVASNMADYHGGVKTAIEGRNLNSVINKPITKAGRITADMYWERITYFLDRVVPVANQYKVKLASHMEDAMVPQPYESVDLVTNTIEGAKKFVSIQESPYHGLLFCIGTFSEMLENPKRDIYDVVRWFGDRKKIHLVDFRNIRGNHQSFVETFPDEGDIDLLRVMQVLKETGYDGMVVPDHQPVNPDGLEQVNAFQYGYIRGLMQAIDYMT
jgi:mannonate dehydratase